MSFDAKIDPKKPLPTGPIRIIGLDPGLLHTGWGFIDVNGSTLSHVAHGVITTSSQDEMGFRLHTLHQQLSDIMETFKPDAAAVEEIFLNKNPHSTLKLGMARGVAILTPATFSIPVTEYSANKIKKTVVGVGHADKNQVSQMVRLLLPKAGDVKADAADALAIAICHAQHRGPMVAS